MKVTRESALMGHHSPSLERLMRMQVDEEYAEHALVAVAGQMRVETLEPEIARRTEAFAAKERSTAEGLGGISPRCAALKSVARDVALGVPLSPPSELAE